MTVEDSSADRRKHKRVPVDFPVVCRIRGTPVLGWSVNACNRGMLVTSYLPLKTAIRILGVLNRTRSYPVEVEFTHNKSYRAEAEIKHFHIELSSEGRCRSFIGLFMSKVERTS